MSGAGFQVDASDIGIANAALERIMQLGQTTQFLDDLGAQLVGTTEARFTAEVDPDLEPWAALSPKYAQRKAKVSSGGKLQRTGDLITSLTHNVLADGLEVGTNLEYAEYHQFGAPNANIVPRPFLGISAEDRDLIQDLVEQHLEQLQ